MIYYLILFALSLLGDSHALYLSTVQIEHKVESDTASVQIKVFTDDLQSALRNAGEASAMIPAEELCQNSHVELSNYFDQHLKIKINGLKSTLSYKSCTLENDVFLLGFEIDCPKNWKEVQVVADYFMELFPTQTNVFQVSTGDTKRFFRVTKKQPQGNTKF